MSLELLKARAMSFVWFYHRNALYDHHGNSGSHSSSVKVAPQSNHRYRKNVNSHAGRVRHIAPMRERSYRQFPHHRNSGVAGISKSIDNLPPPPK